MARDRSRPRRYTVGTGRRTRCRRRFGLESRLTRRELIRTGLGGLALLALGGCARPGAASGRFDDPGYTYRWLTGGDRDLIAAVGTVMLAGALPADSAAHDVALVQVVRGVDVAIDGLPPNMQYEIGQ